MIGCFAVMVSIAFALPVQAQDTEGMEQREEQKEQQRGREGGQGYQGAQGIKDFGQGESYEEIIQNDHELVSWYVDQLANEMTPEERAVLFNNFKRGLKKHMKAEEEYFYPRLQEESRVKAKDQHMAIERQLEKVKPTKEEGDTFQARLSVLKELIDTHVQYEEGELLDQSKNGEGDQQRITEKFRSIYTPR
jgi:hemerythrin superfamily protein